ncbi:MAG: Rpn family recombination-promoting nuclease/putative transposase [Bacteroidetes bacterium]|nr:Rpn family recombination-promoting nuclease/putative transposase [Bacteroidota bacterium]MCL1969686.1 Rpn family recombination-promoting nuclease/putative transposase [Bacteroidota bacterium]
MAHYLDPKNDYAFKRVFGEHKHLCMSLINSLLPLENPVVDIEYQTGELIPELPDLRNSIVDVRCTDTNGRQFIVEMQMYWTESFKSRVLLNASKAYIKQLDKTEEFKLLQPVYALNFVNDIFEKSPEKANEYYHHYKIVNIKDTEKQIEGLEFIFIELPKFKPQNRAEQKLYDLWLRFLTEINGRTEVVPQELIENELIREALAYMEISAYTKGQLEVYDKYRDVIMTERSFISDAFEEGEAKGMKKGMRRGMEKGMKKGIEEGIKKGETETLERIVVESKRNNLSIEQIELFTKLTKTQIIEILKRQEENHLLA